MALRRLTGLVRRSTSMAAPVSQTLTNFASSGAL
jgi:hypothetical protein